MLLLVREAPECHANNSGRDEATDIPDRSEEESPLRSTRPLTDADRVPPPGRVATFESLMLPRGPTLPQPARRIL